LIDNVRDVICSLDAGGVLLSANAAAQPMFGCQATDLIGKLFFDLIATEDRQRVITLMRSLPVATGTTMRIQTRLNGRGSDAVHVVLSAYWSAVDQSYYCILHDDTERWQIQRMRRQFVAMITHDLRSPLNSIINTFDAIEEQLYSPLSPRGLERIQDSIRNIDRMLRLLADLLSLVNVDATSIAVELAPTSLKEIVDESIGSVRAHAEHDNIGIEAELIEVSVLADRHRMVQVLVNLLSNAVKFSISDAVVQVCCTADKNIARIEVKDTGRGISPADQKLIFEPYRQVESGTANLKLKGTGLGLTVCKTIVEAHNGRIGVISEESVGSTFWIEIPLSSQSTST
jgi:PAS domain S-box-containing protein